MSQHSVLVIVKVLVIIGVISLSAKLSAQTNNLDTTILRRKSSGGIATLASNNVDTKSEVDNTSRRRNKSVSQLDIPIFLMNPTSHEISAVEWSSIAKLWDRNTTYSDFLQLKEKEPSSITISDATIPFPPDKQILTFHHLMPKTASSTLRQSCQDAQRTSCGILPKSPNDKRPDGYMTWKRLQSVMNDCPSLRHVCVKADTQPLVKNYTLFHDTNVFLHLFPMRPYEEWVVSALKQVYFRDGEKGCEEEDALLNQCLPHKYELDISRYGKAAMSYWMKSYKHLRRKDGLGFEKHHWVLMYDYRYLHDTLRILNREYNVPLLEGTDVKKNSERHEGTCKDDVVMLQKFHDCFVGQLARFK
eukprot:scaffold249315_cov39-Cyclotella_meneghiniana.AAC.6